MFLAMLMLLACLPSSQAKKGLLVEDLPKPDMKALIEYSIPPQQATPEYHILKVKFPATVKLGTENWVFDGDQHGIVSVLVEKEGEEAKPIVLGFLLDVKKAMDADTPMPGLIMVDPWVGQTEPHNFQLDKSRAGQMYILFSADPTVIVSMLASWPVGDDNAKREAFTMASYVIWTLRSTLKPSKS